MIRLLAMAASLKVSEGLQLRFISGDSTRCAPSLPPVTSPSLQLLKRNLLHMSSSRPSKSDYIETDTGNKVSRKCHIFGSQNIILGGKTIIQPSVVIRGDLRRAGGSGAAVVIAVGKYCVLGEGCVIRPPCKTYKG